MSGVAGGTGSEDGAIGVAHLGRVRELRPGEVYTFGRASTCDACLDPDDLAISRIAGSVEHDGGTWWVVNRSSARPLSVADEIGIPTVVAPGRRIAVVGPLTVLVDGSVRRHAVTVEAATAGDGPPPVWGAPDAPPTETAAHVSINEADRLALVALFRGYLEPFPRYSPYPRSYAVAAEDVGWPRSTLVKRVEYLRTRLTDAGVANLVGENALQHLAEWALATGVITRDDLGVLNREKGPRSDG